MNQSDKEVLLSIKNLDVVFGRGKRAFKAIDNVSFDIYKGETLSLVGESGSGKTTTLKATIAALKDEFRIGVMEADIDSEGFCARLGPGADDFPGSCRFPERARHH